MSEDRDLTLRLVCGLLASVARMVPVPFLDDILRERALQLMVSRTLKAHGRMYSSSKVTPLWGDSRGCAEGCLVFVLTLPVKLLLFPLRKITVWIMAVKYIATDLSEAVLLGRALDHTLSRGQLPAAAEDGLLHEDAARIRLAFDNALKGTDMKLLKSALFAALRSVKGLPSAALAALRKLRKQEDTDPTAGLSGAQKETVEKGTSAIRAVLESEEIAPMLERFDQTFADNLRILESRKGS